MRRTKSPLRLGVVIIGTGSQARYAIDIFSRGGLVEIIGLADVERRDNVGTKVAGFPVVCFVDEISDRYSPEHCRVIVAYGKNERKRDIVTDLARQGYHFAIAISSRAYLAARAHVGDGSIVNPQVTVMPDAQIGQHVIVHSNSVVEHDCVIGDYANIGPGVTLGGGVRVNEGAYVFTGASVIPRVTIGRWAVVGAGAVVTEDVPEYDVVAGVPAHSIMERKTQ